MLVNLFRTAKIIDPITAIAMFLGSIIGVLLILYLSNITINAICYTQTNKTLELKKRMIFNPLKHFDFFGIIMLLIIGITFTKQRSYSEEDFVNRKKGLIIRGISGLSYYLITTLLAALLIYLSFNIGRIQIVKGNNAINFLILFYYAFCVNIFSISFFMFIFNCIPVFPQYSFDIIDAQLSYQARQKKSYFQYKQFGIFIALISLYLIFTISSKGMYEIINALMGGRQIL